MCDTKSSLLLCRVAEQRRHLRFRLFYRVDAEQRQVRILAIAVKERHRIFLAGEEVEL